MSMGRKQGTSTGRAAVRWAAALAILAVAAGCALFSKPYKPTLLETKTLVFYPDRTFNQGMALPLDICYVPLKGSASQVTAVSPDQWFAKHKRDKYPYKKAMSFRPSNDRRPVKVQLKPPAETQELVLVADYINLKGAKGQQVVIPAPGKETEVVFVTDKGIYR